NLIINNNSLLKYNKSYVNSFIHLQKYQQVQKREFFSKLFGKKKNDTKSKTLGSAMKSGKISSLQQAFSWSKLEGSDIKTAVYTIGTNNQGQLGLGDWKSESQLTFNELLQESSIKSVKSTLLHSAAMTNKNDLLTWGANFNFQIGHKYGSDTSLFPNFIESTPFSVKTSNFPNMNLVSYSIGGWSSFVLLKDPKEQDKQIVYSWGNNHCGQLGIGSLYNVQTPNIVKFKDQSTVNSIKKISSGLYHTMILLNSGKLLSCGKSNDGQLGIKLSNNNNNNNNSKNSSDSSNSVQIPLESNLLKELNLIDIEAGYFHSLGLDDSGNVYQWGNGKLKYETSEDLLLSPTSLINQYDEINSNNSNRVIRIQGIELESNDRIKQIGGGDGISMALTESGKLFKWNTLDNKVELINWPEFKNQGIERFALSNTHAAVTFKSTPNEICVWSLNETDFQLERSHGKSLFFSILQKGEKIKNFTLPNDHIIKDFSVGSHFMIVLAENI
ncbi:hypothetical protein DICPUDRAFT_16980, partial [Dictyostelium purpureum]